MELSSSKIKRFLILTKIELPYISGRNFPSSYSGKMELSSSNIKKLLTFSQEEAVLIFQEPQKNFLKESFQKKALPMFQETETLNLNFKLQEAALCGFEQSKFDL